MIGRKRKKHVITKRYDIPQWYKISVVNSDAIYPKYFNLLLDGDALECFKLLSLPYGRVENISPINSPFE